MVWLCHRFLVHPDQVNCREQNVPWCGSSSRAPHNVTLGFGAWIKGCGLRVPDGRYLISMVANHEGMTTESCILRKMSTFHVLQPSPHQLSDHSSGTSLNEVQEKSVLSQLRPSTPESSTNHIQHDARIKGFTTVTVAVSLVGIN